MPLSIPIIYEDDEMVAVNKPAGLMVHRDGKSNEETLADQFVDAYPASRDVGEPIVLSDGNEIARPGIVHRLDRHTSGVMLLAKTPTRHALLKQAFKDRQINKIYHAIVWGTMEASGSIDKPIGRARGDFRKWTAEGNTRGTVRDASTHYRVLGSSQEYSYIELKPQTGRTHQIRVHCKAIGRPVVCDTLYAPKRACTLGFSRQALHAFAIQLRIEDTDLHFEAPLPDDFTNALHELGLQ